MPGPLPSPGRRRANPSAIAATALPADGRKGPIPKCPNALGASGAAWWRWAWRTPQAAAWDPGQLYALARRARIEDDLNALDAAESLDLAGLACGSDSEREAVRTLEVLIRRLKALSGGRSSLLREARELDNRFGLTAKGLADLRWHVGRVPTVPVAPTPQTNTNVHRLRAVDPGAQ